MAIEKSKLLRCPFCGGEAEIEIIEPHTHSDWIKATVPDLPDCEGEAFVFCTKCSAAITGENEAEAIKLWNRRADDGRE